MAGRSIRSAPAHLCRWSKGNKERGAAVQPCGQSVFFLFRPPLYYEIRYWLGAGGLSPAINSRAGYIGQIVNADVGCCLDAPPNRILQTMEARPTIFPPRRGERGTEQVGFFKGIVRAG